MIKSIKEYKLFITILLFVTVPLLIWYFGDVPKKDFLRETASVVTLVSFFFLISQFYLTRSMKQLIKAKKYSTIVKIHKYSGYIFLILILLHPFAIVLPKLFENNLPAKEAFIRIISTTDSSGIIMGIISWLLLLTLGITSFLRKKFRSYNFWRKFHGVLSVLFIVGALWHVIDLGKHTNELMSIYIITLVSIAVYFTARLYIKKGA